MLNNKILEIIRDRKVTYNKDNDIIYINGVECNDYEKRVLCAIFEEHTGQKTDIDKVKEAIIEYNNVDDSVIDVNTDINILDEITNIIDNDDSIKKSDWEKFKEWKYNDAIWKTDKDGARTNIIDCFENIVGFIEYYPKTKGKIKFNKIRNIVEYNGRQITDNDYHSIMNDICKYFLPTFSKLKMIKDAVDNVANKHKFNPWTDYFDRLVYVDDGIDYIDYTIRNILCCEDIDTYYDLYYETLKIMMLGTMERIYNKELYGRPTKYDMVTTFCSTAGGSGKTTYLELLYDIDGNGNSYCYVVSGDSFAPKDKDFIERTHQSVCVLLDELSMKRAIVTSVKGYITQRDDRFRKAYGFNSEAHMRGFILTASSNNNDILKDYTTDNERRWAIIKVSEDKNNYKKVNKAFDEGYRDKMWAYIKNIYKSKNYLLYFDDEKFEDMEKDIQRGYKASNNESYDTIINDILEREYGFYDENVIDADTVVAQYKYGNSAEWCNRHNDEISDKKIKSQDGSYIMKPEDRYIRYYGKINRIQKTILYNILDKLKIEYTKKSLEAEMRFTGIWNGYDNKPCFINGKTTRAYWRKNEDKWKLISNKYAIIEDEINENDDETDLPF